MSKYTTFIFKNYTFDTGTKTLTLQYGLDDAVTFTETFTFNFPFVDYDPIVLDRAIQNLFFMAGVSYFKTYIPAEISIEKGSLDGETAAFFSNTYERGLGEFFYVNKLDPHTPVTFPTNDTIAPLTPPLGDGVLIGLGGGKDSLVSVELLRSQNRIATWSLGHQELLQPLVDRIGLPHFTVDRIWDRTLLEHNAAGAYNGHVPISAIFACVGTVVGALTGYGTAVVSNENSANEPTLQYQGMNINHQYSKSSAFEQDYQAILQHQFSDGLQYFSFLRPLSELAIAELFARTGFATYADVFSSCNRAFVHTNEQLFWCGECPKCAFVFLALTPFIERSKLENLFPNGGKNLLLDPAMEPMYKRLLGIEGDKPLECVGEVKESRAAMQAAFAIYPELAQKYQFELPAEYDWRALAPHNMPEHFYQLLLTALAR